MLQYNSNLYDIETRNSNQLHLFPTRTVGARNVLRHRIPELIYRFPADVLEKAKTHSITAFPNHIKNQTLQLYSHDCIESHCVCNNTFAFCAMASASAGRNGLSRGLRTRKVLIDIMSVPNDTYKLV